MEWHRQFWEEPQAKADFSHWAKVPAWNLGEIAALMLGRDPSFFNSAEFFEGTQGSEFAGARYELLDILYRHVAAGELYNLTASTKVIDWAEKYDFALPQELVERVRDLQVRRVKQRESPMQEPTMPALETPTREAARIRMSEPKPERQSVNVTDPLTEYEFAVSKDPGEIPLASQAKRQLANLRALLAAMAISKYSYKPDAAKSDVPQMLASLLERQGVPLSAQTIRNHLEAGSKLLEKARPEK
jgi:hypothetical protein